LIKSKKKLFLKQKKAVFETKKSCHLKQKKAVIWGKDLLSSNLKMCCCLTGHGGGGPGALRRGPT
jgi:hypothetical protein